MKPVLLGLALLMAAALAASSAAHAGQGHGYGRDDELGDASVFYDRARVLSADPVYDIVQTPVERRECWREERTEMRRGGGGAGMLAGGIIGGVLGHEIGDGDQRKVATVAGTLIGAAVGREMERDKSARAHTVEERRCRVYEEIVEEEYLRGYRVTYQYQGRRFTTFTEEHPGKFLHLQIGLVPVRD
jgi:uncharacterized protein YcfJ